MRGAVEAPGPKDFEAGRSTRFQRNHKSLPGIAGRFPDHLSHPLLITPERLAGGDARFLRAQSRNHRGQMFQHVIDLRVRVVNTQAESDAADRRLDHFFHLS
jgi:hypothetical protein